MVPRSFHLLMWRQEFAWWIQYCPEPNVGFPGKARHHCSHIVVVVIITDICMPKVLAAFFALIAWFPYTNSFQSQRCAWTSSPTSSQRRSAIPSCCHRRIASSLIICRPEDPLPGVPQPVASGCSLPGCMLLPQRLLHLVVVDQVQRRRASKVQSHLAATSSRCARTTIHYTKLNLPWQSRFSLAAKIEPPKHIMSSWQW